MYFCPFCGSLLQLARPELFQFSCPTCRFIVAVQRPLTKSHSFLSQNKRADADDAFQPQSSDSEGSQITTTRCQSAEDCKSDKAYFVQVQMRSADEPPSTFFKCVACGFQWRVD